MKKLLVSVLLFLFTLLSLPAYGHGGGTNSSGCHNDRKNGGYHCHNSGRSSSISSRKKALYNGGKPSSISSGKRAIYTCIDSSGHTSIIDRPCTIRHGERKKERLISVVDNSPSFSPFGTVDQSSNSTGGSLVRRVDYDGFTLWVDCSKRAAVKFQYNAQRDSGNFKRAKRFFIDDKLPTECRQLSAKTYGRKYDRGHLVPANHLDHSRTAIKQSNTMANILPQAKNMNRGAWLMTEEITECYRDIDELLIIGGAIWSNDSGADYFKHSHGVRTPSKFWKVIIRGVGSNLRVIAWIIPNSMEAKRGRLDDYLVSIDDIERVTGEKIPVPDYEKEKKAYASWFLPRGCNKG